MLMSFHLIVVVLLASLGSVQGLLHHCSGKAELCALEILGGFKPPLKSRLADCSSFQRVTVPPAAQTTTRTLATRTVTRTTTIGVPGLQGAEIPARQETIAPTAVPTYLGKPCNQASIYGSACSCLGIPLITTTAPTPTETLDVTTTTTTTLVVTPTCTGGTCTTYEIHPCPESPAPFSECFCGTDINGNSYCSADIACPNDSCSSNADCPSGNRCLVNSCCNMPVCTPEVDILICNNTAPILLTSQAFSVANLTSECLTSSSLDEDSLDLEEGE